MLRLSLVCLLAALGGLGAVEPLPVAPAPRPALPQLSLVVVENVTGPAGTVDTRRVLRVGLRSGKVLPSETLWEGDERFLGHFGGHRLAGARCLVTKYGGVIDLHDKKVIHDEQDDELCAIIGTKVFYRNTGGERTSVFSFDLNTGKAQRETGLVAEKFALPGVVAPDGMASVESRFSADELFLHQPGEERKSLGKGFHIDISTASSVFGPSPVAWINNGVFVTQKGNGNLKLVDVTGKVTDLLTIKDAPKELVSAPYFFRDGSNRLVYVCGSAAYAIDPDKKTATKYEWQDFGHGFEVSWTSTPKLGHKIRHNGKEIGQFNCIAYTAKTAPGHLAVESRVDQESTGPPDHVAVWSAGSGEWALLKLWPNCIVGWVVPNRVDR